MYMYEKVQHHMYQQLKPTEATTALSAKQVGFKIFSSFYLMQETQVGVD